MGSAGARGWGGLVLAVFSAAPVHPAPAPVAAQALVPASGASALPGAVPGVQRLRGRLSVHLVNAEFGASVELLARVTGSRLHGMPASPSRRITLQAAELDVPGAWKLLLDLVPNSYALRCSAQACQIWFAGAEGHRQTDTALPAPPLRRVESTEEGN